MSASPRKTLPITLATARAIVNDWRKILDPVAAEVEPVGCFRRWISWDALRHEWSSRTIDRLALCVRPKSFDGMIPTDAGGLFSPAGPVFRLCDRLECDGRLTALEGFDLGPGVTTKKTWIYRRMAVIEIIVVVPPAEWGTEMVLRTAEERAAKMLSLPLDRGGVLPLGLRVAFGGLCWSGLHVGDPEKTPCHDRCRRHTEDEAEFFAALGMPWRPPHLRAVHELSAWASGDPSPWLGLEGVVSQSQGGFSNHAGLREKSGSTNSVAGARRAGNLGDASVDSR